MTLLQNCKYFNCKLFSDTIKYIHMCHKHNVHLSSYKERKRTETQDSNFLQSENEEKELSAQQLISYIRSNDPQLLNVLPSHYYRSSTTPNTLYLIDRNAAKDIVSWISKDILENESLIVECTPGPGYLTNELLNIGVSKLYLYEQNTMLYGSLKVLQNEHPDRIVVKKMDFFKTCKSWYYNKIKLEDIFNQIYKKEWEEESNMKIIAFVTQMKIFKDIIFSVIFRSWIMTINRPIFFLGVLPSQWSALTSTDIHYTLYNTRAVMFQLLFDYKIVGIINRQAFLPWQKNVKCSKKAVYKKDKDHKILYMVRIEPKADIFTNIGDPILCWYFIRHHLIARSTRVIPALERLVPGCGPKLIAKNMNIYTQFGQLKPHQLLDLYKEFSSWPESKQTIFSSSNNNLYRRVGYSTDINKDTDSIM